MLWLFLLVVGCDGLVLGAVGDDEPLDVPLHDVVGVEYHLHELVLGGVGNDEPRDVLTLRAVGVDDDHGNGVTLHGVGVDGLAHVVVGNDSGVVLTLHDVVAVDVHVDGVTLHVVGGDYLVHAHVDSDLVDDEDPVDGLSLRDAVDGQAHSVDLVGALTRDTYGSGRSVKPVNTSRARCSFPRTLAVFPAVFVTVFVT